MVNLVALLDLAWNSVEQYVVQRVAILVRGDLTNPVHGPHTRYSQYGERAKRVPANLAPSSAAPCVIRASICDDLSVLGRGGSVRPTP